MFWRACCIAAAISAKVIVVYVFCLLSIVVKVPASASMIVAVLPDSVFSLWPEMVVVRWLSRMLPPPIRAAIFAMVPSPPMRWVSVVLCTTTPCADNMEGTRTLATSDVRRRPRMRRSSQKDEMTWTAGAPARRDRGQPWLSMTFSATGKGPPVD